MALGLYALTWWLLWMLAPARGQEPSELFKLLAQAVVLTAFVNGAVGALYVASRDGQKKNDTIASQARVLADQAAGRAADPPAPGTASITAAADVDVELRQAEEPRP